MQKTPGQKTYDLVAISSVCVDIQFRADDALLSAQALEKAHSNPVSPQKLASLLDGRDAEKSPGSPGVNVANGIALRGGRAALIGKIANDAAGVFLAGHLQKNGVDFTPVVSTDPKDVTTQLAVITTPDRERTFAYPENAAGYGLQPEDVDESLIAASKILYIDAYLFLTENGRRTAEHAAAIAKKNKTLIAVGINNAGLMAEKREIFTKLVARYADIVVGDKKEFLALFDRDGLGQALLAASRAASDYKFIASMTAGASGAAWAAEVIQHMGAEPKIAPKNGGEKPAAPKL